MTAYLTTIAFIFAIMAVGIAVDRLYRRFASKNPRLGPFRDTSKCGSCSGGSGCSDETCDAEGVETTAKPIKPFRSE